MMKNKEAYQKGFEDGLACFAWWKDGVQYVGTSGSKLKDAVENSKLMHNYDPPKEEDNGRDG
jgi:hypothetical protein